MLDNHFVRKLKISNESKIDKVVKYLRLNNEEVETHIDKYKIKSIDRGISLLKDHSMKRDLSMNLSKLNDSIFFSNKEDSSSLNFKSKSKLDVLRCPS